MSDASRSALRATDLSIVAGGRSLLEGASFDVRDGEVVLLCAPSGTGKTVLLKVVAGLITPETAGFALDGSLEVDGVDVLAPDARPTTGRVGIVFQDYALLQGTTVGMNVAFAQDHRDDPPTGDAARSEADTLAEEIGLDARTPVDALSGGQKQRAAIARTLAYQPRVIAYDEPTSGLDPANKERVAKRIRETNRRYGTTSIVVTHDVAGLVGYVDRVLLIDPATRRIEEVARDDAVARLSAIEPGVAPPPAAAPLASRAVSATAAFFGSTTTSAGAALTALGHLVPRWRSPRWGMRFLVGFLRLFAGPSALLYFGLSGFVIGFVTTYFTLHFLPYREFTEGLILDDLVGALGFGLYRILVPLIIAILMAARGGAAIAADVGGRVASHQFEAMRSLGASPRRYLLTGVLWAVLLGTPLIAAIAFLAAKCASAIVFAFMQPDMSLHFWDQLFHGRLYEGTGWVALRYFVSAFAIATVAYFRGERPKRSPDAVGDGITTTIIVTSLLVLTVQVVISFFEFRTL